MLDEKHSLTKSGKISLIRSTLISSVCEKRAAEDESSTVIRFDDRLLGDKQSHSICFSSQQIFNIIF